MAATVTVLNSWTEGNVTGKRHTVKHVQVDLITANSVSATALGFTTLIEVGTAAYYESGIFIGAAMPVIDYLASPMSVNFADPNNPSVGKPTWVSFGVITGRMIFIVRGY